MNNNYYDELNDQRFYPFTAVVMPQAMKDTMSTVIEDSRRKHYTLAAPVDYCIFASEAKEAALGVLRANSEAA